jgi:RNA polymerase sigma factor (sigma-70 family)
MAAGSALLIQDFPQLAERIRRGEAAAEEELARFFAQRIFVLALARTRDPEAARELVNDVLFAVLRALRNGAVREAERLGAFVYGTARNQVNSYLRARGRTPPEEPLPVELPGADPVENLESAERLRLVRTALDRLDEKDRDIMHLTLIEGLKPGEIAARLGLTSEFVRQRKARAIKKVSQILRGASRK